MKIILFCTICFSSFFISISAQSKDYNQKLADSLQADQYGMKQYFLVILKTGEMDSQITDKKKRAEIFKGHFDHIAAMSKSGKLVVAGPFGKNNHNYRGLFILHVATENEAMSLINQDPTIKEKILESEIVSWYGSAALPLYLQYHDAISKEKL